MLRGWRRCFVRTDPAVGWAVPGGLGDEVGGGGGLVVRRNREARTVGIARGNVEGSVPKGGSLGHRPQAHGVGLCSALLTPGWLPGV